MINEKITAIVFDTCIWLNLIENKKFLPFLDKSLEFLDKNLLNFIIPEIVKIEFKNNKPKVIDKVKNQHKAYLQQASQLSIFLNGSESIEYKEMLKRISQKIDVHNTEINEVLYKIEKINNHRNTIHISVSDEVKLKATNRAIEKKWPFFKNKNSICDAIIVECLIEYLNSNPFEKVYFISNNTSDFCQQNNPKLIHEGIKEQFESKNIEYFNNPGEAFNKIKTNAIPKTLIEDYDYWEKLGNLITHWTDYLEKCNVCGGVLENRTYRVMNGTPGWHFICSKCGLQHLIVDFNY